MGYWEVETKAMTSFFNKDTAPKHITKQTNSKYESMPLIMLKERSMWSKRLEKIIPYIPKDAWIAGGFLRSIIAAEDDSDGDIDFFFHTEESFSRTMDLIKHPSFYGAEKVFNYYRIPEYDNINELRIIDCESLVAFRPNIQLVRLYWFNSPEHVIDSFDFTVCQLITDGKTLWFNPQAFEDIKTKTLRQHRETGDAIAILNRILKYQSKGYKISQNAFDIAEKNAIKTLSSPDEVIKYFYLDDAENNKHKRSVSPVQRAWDYLETAPASAALYANIKKKKVVEKKQKIFLDTSVKKMHTWDGS